MEIEGYAVNSDSQSDRTAGCPYHSAPPTHPIAAEGQARGPVFFHPQMQLWVVTGHADVLAGLKDHGRFSIVGAIDSASMLAPEALEVLRPVSPLFVHSLMNLDPPEHTRLRSLVGKAFSPRQIARLEPTIRRIIDEILEQIFSAGQAEVVQQIAQPVPIRVFSTLLGLPQEDHEQIQRWTNDWMGLILDLLPPEQQVPRARSLVAYIRYIDALIEQRRRQPQDDLISALLASTEEGSAPLSAAELRDTICMLALAGFETTTSMMAACLYRLLAEPGCWGALRCDPQLVAQAVEESLRLSGVVRGLLRITREDVTVQGVQIPKGATVMLMSSAANLDAEVFERPDQFDLRRPNLARHLAFGSGAHTCLGAPLARLEIQMVVRHLLRRMPSLSLAPGQSVSYLPIARLQSLERLLVEWDER